jgi:hypothetical protein
MPRLQERAAVAMATEWVNTLAATNADFMREMSAVYFQAARGRPGDQLAAASAKQPA